MMIGCARLSTEDQNLDLQLTALKRAGCKHIFTDQASRAHVKHPELTQCLKALKEGDTLNVSRGTLDRALQGQFEFAGGLVIRQDFAVFFARLAQAHSSASLFVDVLNPIDTCGSAMPESFTAAERDLIRTEFIGVCQDSCRVRPRSRL